MQNLPLFRRYFVYFAAVTASMLSFSAGVITNWAATIVPHLKSNDSSENPLPQPPTALESSWIVSILMAGCIAGPVLAGILMAAIGKKKTILLLGIPAFISHLTIAFATSVWVFLIARFIMGLTLGCIFGVISSYIGDIAEDKNRGLLGSLTAVFISIGGLSVYVIGPFISVKLFSLINLIPLILLFTLFGLLVPETPLDLLMKNSTNEAKKSLALYRGKAITEIEPEFKKLQDSINNDENQAKKKISTVEQMKIIYRTKSLFRGLRIATTVFLFNTLSGMSAIVSYYQTIFDESAGSLESIYSVMIIGVVTLFGAVLNLQLVERLGRKILLLIGVFLMGVSLISLGTYFMLKDQGHNTDPISWLPLVSLMTYTFAYNIQGSVPWILLTDLFSSDILVLCGTIMSCGLWSLAFVIALGFPYLQDILGNNGTFFMFGGFMIFDVIYICLFVFETKGKSNEEVQELLNK